MTTTQGVARPRTNADPMVIAKSGNGYKVYAVNFPARSYQVTGPAEEPACTCPEFKLNHRNDPSWRCEHIQAVYDRHNDQGRIGTQLPEAEPGHGQGSMLLKRSVSPDGRIDSLSIEFSCPTGGIERGELIAMAVEVLELQRDIAATFLRGGDREPPRPPNGPTANGQSISATIIELGALNGRWGRRHYLTFDVEGRAVKLFGAEEELAAALQDAGYSGGIRSLRPGAQVSIPCRVRTKPARDSRYLDIDQVFPAQSPKNGRGYR